MNHSSPHCLVSTTLVAIALETWLNEVITIASRYCATIPDGLMKSLLDATTLQKYRKLASLISAEEIEPMPDLDTLIDLRDEIVHFIPRAIKSNVPPWFNTLETRNLFITSSDPSIDFLLPEKLASYRLTYWAWETAETAALRLQSLSTNWSTLASNFSIYRSGCAPERLPQFDAKHGLLSTPAR